MDIKSIVLRKSLLSVGQFIGLALLFGICYTQDALYTKNQNTKFLYGLANAGLGFLKEDWLANTIDPLPVFSFLVTVTSRYCSEYAFYIYYLIILGVYIYSNLGIVSHIYKINRSNLKYLISLALLLAIHCINIKIFEFETGFHLHSGVALQYVLGSYFQPSTFGIFLIFSIYAFLRKRTFLAVLALAFAATIHPTYISSAAILTLSYIIILYKEDRNLKRVFLVGALAFILVLPVFSYMSLTFRPTSPEFWEKAKSIIVNVRIPHHSLPGVWLKDSTAYIQILIVFYAIYLIRETRLFIVMFVPTLTATVLTIIQLVVNNSTIAFIAPWRFSAFLVPISTFIITAALISHLFDKFRKPIIRNKKILTNLSLIIIVTLFIMGSVKQVKKLTKYDGNMPTMNFVKQTRQSGESYLIPFDISEDSSETSKYRNLDKFRLYTGVPIFVNFKSHPYKDTEIIEWYNRVLMAQRFYEAQDNTSCELLNTFASDYGITHVVFQNPYPHAQCDRLEKLYENFHHVVYRIN
jgi:hypothetical protein